jgi:hypothetical protein
MNMVAKVADFFDSVKLTPKFDVILFIFTLLEMDFTIELFLRANELLEIDGHVIIVMPDSLKDVCKAALSNSELLQNYLENTCILDKIDKFTKKSYPFKAHRFESIVKFMLGSGLIMVGFESSVVKNNEIFLIIFKKVSEIV